MADLGLGGYKSINSFVEAKLDSFGRSEKNFASLFELMFCESQNVMYERSEGYRIKKTTYGEAKAHILSRAAALRAQLGNIGEDAVVGLCMDNSLAWIECFWAIICAGCRPLLMNLRLPKSALDDALSTLGAIAVIGERDDFTVPAISPNGLSTDGEAARPERFGSEVFVMSSGTSEHVKLCAYGAEEFYYQILDSYEIIKNARSRKSITTEVSSCSRSFPSITFSG